MAFNYPVPNAGTLNSSTDPQAQGVIFVTAARDQTTDSGLGAGIYASAEIANPNARGVRLYTVVANGSGTVAFKVQVRNPYLDTWVDLPGAAIAAYNNNTKMITIYPGLTGIADVADSTNNQHLGSSWRVVATVATASETFSVAGDYLQ